MKWTFLWVAPSQQWFVFDDKNKHRFEIFDCEWLEKVLPGLDKDKRNYVEFNPILKGHGERAA